MLKTVNMKICHKLYKNSLEIEAGHAKDILDPSKTHALRHLNNHNQKINQIFF